MERLTSRLDTDEKRIKELKDEQEELLKEQQRERRKQKTIRHQVGGGVTDYRAFKGLHGTGLPLELITTQILGCESYLFDSLRPNTPQECVMGTGVKVTHTLTNTETVWLAGAKLVLLSKPDLVFPLSE